jgi:DNA-directed DNA polymerase III PolC
MPAGKIGLHLRAAGLEAGALRDRGNLYGALEFYEGCVAEGIKPLVGVDLVCPVTGRELGLVALTRDGYANLCRIISKVNLDGETPLIGTVRGNSQDIAVLAADADSALELVDSIGRDRVWLELVGNRDPASVVREKLVAATRHSLRTVASWEVRCLDPTEHRISQVLRAIGDGKTVEQVAPDARDASLKQSPGLAEVFRNEPRLLDESARLAEMADLKIETGRPHFPRISATPAQSLAELERMCLDALPGKYPQGRAKALARLGEELRTISALGLADYFLVVADIVGFARNRAIPVTGRGSGVGSIVAYLADITQVDPVSEELLFERFLNELRPDYPDLDIDISWKRRDEVIEYVYRRFGSENVAMISTRACFELRLAAREVAKAFGLSPYEAQALADRLPYHAPKDPRGAIVSILGDVKPELRPQDRRAIGELASSIIGFPNHSSMHCGGIVVSDRPLTYYTPLERAAKGIQVTQFDMYSIERIGLVKIDLLGNRALGMIEEATAEIRRSRGSAPEVRPDDPETAKILRSGSTLGCFQLESPAMRNLLGMMRATTRTDATLALALVRPGPSAGGMKQEFLRRRLVAAAGDGCPEEGPRLPVYEEDVMRIIAEHTGVGFAEADLFRRSLKEEAGDGGALQAKFVLLAQSAGVGRSEALRAWHDVKRFARYTFSKAHAASFGALAYAAAYLKANFPLEFYAGVLRNPSGMYPPWVHVNEARRVGVRVLLPSVNHSQMDFSIECGSLRTGFVSIKNLPQATIEAIVRERREAPFQSLSDFLARVPAGKEATLGLIASGAFDPIEPDRCQALTEYLASGRKHHARGELWLGLGETHFGPPSRPFTLLQERKMEYTTLGFSPLVHPLEFFESRPGNSDRGWGADVTKHCPDPADSRPGSRQPHPPGPKAVRGLVAALRHFKEKGPGLWFVSLDNPDGISECIVPAGVRPGRLELGQACLATGISQDRLGISTLRVRSIENLPERFD